MFTFLEGARRPLITIVIVFCHTVQPSIWRRSISVVSQELFPSKFLQTNILRYTNSLFHSTGAESDIVSTTGDAAFLPCPLPSDLQNVTKISIQWIKDGVKEPKLCRYFIESNKSYNPECRNRFSVTTKPLGLNITTVESSDAGLYTCLVTKTIPPPAKETTFNLTLQVNGDYYLLLLFPHS